MTWKRFLQLSLGCATASAFRDSSPFFFFSTSSLPQINSLPSQLVLKGSSVSSSVLKAVQNCPSDAYVLVSQPGASVKDFEENGTINLRRRMNKQHDDAVHSAYSIPNVLGAVDVPSVESHLLKKCGTIPTHVDGKRYNIALSESYPQLIKVDFSELPTSSKEREQQMAMQDSFLNLVLDNLSERAYTVIYTTTPPSNRALAALEQSESTAERQNGHPTKTPFVDPSHIDLKRSFDETMDRRQESDSVDDRGLFEKYNYLQPGIFEGILVGLLLLSILYVGISAVSSLQVSYAAFNKENGPAAQKKQQ